jgi:hypothetical protein
MAMTRRKLSVVLALATFFTTAGFVNAFETSHLTVVSPDPGESIVGTPWTGPVGVTETIEQIMARDAMLPPEERAGDQPPRATKPIRDADIAGVDDPSAPAVSRWPDSLVGPPSLLPDDGEQPDLPQTVGLSFVGAQLNGISGTGAIPPDSMGAVGPTQYLVGVNNRIRLYTKAGTLSTLNTTMNNFFASVLPTGGSTSDPQVRFDRLSGRWFVTIITVSSPNHIMIAVSNSSTLVNASSFTFYIFQQDQIAPVGDLGSLADYPSLGIDNNALYIGANMFSGGLYAVSAWVVRKSSILSGGPMVVTAFRAIWNGASGPYSARGVDNDDPSATEGYFIGPNRPALSQLAIRRVTDPGGTPAISGNIILGVPTTAQPITVPAMGSTTNMDALNDRLYAAAMRKNQLTGVRTLWTAHNIRVNSSGTGSNGGDRDGMRWYEIGSMTSTPTLVQSGTLFDSAASNPRFYWMGSVAMSGQGHMALGCSYASVNDWAGVAVAGRLASDTLGATQAPTIAQLGLGAYTLLDGASRNRWGDYSLTTVDPQDDMTMWTIQEYASGNNIYACRVVRLDAPPPATPSSCAPPTLNQGDANVNVTLTGTSVSGSGFFDPDASFPNHIAVSVSGADVTVNSVTFNNPTDLTLNLTVGASAAPGGRTITVTNPDGQMVTSGSILTILCPGPTMPPTIDPIADDTALCGIAYTSPTPTSSAGVAPLTWSLTTGPAGMTIDTSTGVVTWPNPDTSGSPYTITVEATSSFGCGSDTKTWMLTVNPNPPSYSYPNAFAVCGSPYTSAAPTVSGGTPPLTWTLVSGPAGMTIDSSTGVVSWPNPDATGSPYTITVQADSASSCGSSSQSWQLGVVLGDFDADGLVTEADIPGFVADLLATTPICAGDVNNDGLVDGNDIRPFETALGV